MVEMMAHLKIIMKSGRDGPIQWPVEGTSRKKISKTEFFSKIFNFIVLIRNDRKIRRRCEVRNEVV